jgi:hypothetical protein
MIKMLQIIGDVKGAITYAKARKTEATVGEMSLQLDDAKMLLEEFDTRNMQLSRQVEVYRVQSTELRVQTKRKAMLNSKLESRV